MNKNIKKIISILLIVFLVGILFFEFGKKETPRESENKNIQAEYVVKNGEFKEKNLEGASVKNKQDYEKIIESIKMIFPDEYLNMVNKLEIFTDGIENDLAYVTLDDNDAKYWNVSIDIKDTLNKDGELSQSAKQTIVHELFHIISLNETQMEKQETSLKTLKVDEGKTKELSYLNAFYNEFWKSIENERKGVDENSEDSVDEYYQNHVDEFVNSYSATNVVEDIAESFSYFVMGELPSGNKIKDQKIKFFYRYNELVEIRKNIRDVLDN